MIGTADTAGRYDVPTPCTNELVENAAVTEGAVDAHVHELVRTKVPPIDD